MAEELATYMRSVASALRAERRDDAIHEFHGALAHVPDLKAADVPAWAVSQLGQGLYGELLRAYAQHPCMGCRGGVVPCDECRARGFYADDRICDLCTGLGAANCGFCGGSGWITYNFVPPGLRISVVHERVKRTVAAAEQLLGEPPPLSADEPTASLKRLAKYILQLNRRLGALSNALGAVHHPPVDVPLSADASGKIAGLCIRCTQKIDKRLRRVLAAAAKLAREAAAHSASGPRRARAERLGTFYAKLATSCDFLGTSLYHVHLAEARPRPADSDPVGTSAPVKTEEPQPTDDPPPA